MAEAAGPRAPPHPSLLPFPSWVGLKNVPVMEKQALVSVTPLQRKSQSPSSIFVCWSPAPKRVY